MAEDGLCRCGCGQKTKIAPRTYTSRGWVKGQPQPYLRGHAAWKDRGPQWLVNENGCWIWRRETNNEGYPVGSFARFGRQGTGLAHRVFYIQKFGPVPDGLPLDHTCHTADRACPGGRGCIHRLCVNPDHGEPVPQVENVHRGRATKALEADIAWVYQQRLAGVTWRRIAAMLDMTHGPLVTRLRKYCERNSLAWP